MSFLLISGIFPIVKRQNRHRQCGLSQSNLSAHLGKGIYWRGRMTKAQATELKAKWTQQDPPRLCEHLIIDVERTEDAYVTGNYRCLACGDLVSLERHSPSENSQFIT